MFLLRFLALFFLIPTILLSNEFRLNEYSTANNQALCELIKLIKTGFNGQLLEKKWGSCVKISYNNPIYNYCFIKNLVEDPKELESVLSEIKAFYGTTKHSILLDQQNEKLKNEVEKRNYEFTRELPGYYLLVKPSNDLSKFAPLDVTFKLVTTEQEARQWAKVIASAYEDSEEEMFKFCKNNLSNSSAHFYIAFYKEEPVSARSMIVFSDKIAAGSVAGTVLAYRHKGIAGALFSYALEDLKKNHSIQLYVVQTLPSGPIPLKKLKFVEHGNRYFVFNAK